MRAAAVSFLYIALELGVARLQPRQPVQRWAAMGALFVLIPLLCGAAARRAGLSSRAALAAVLAPGAFLTLLMLPFLTLESLSRQRAPGAGGTFHVALTGVLILGAVLGLQGFSAAQGWDRGRS
ncbi:MAG TPA: hypothetical protein VNI01_07760 [Elusimicrobiota bacterium]|nr:hypothetical protein [Elusimicrobiota bacterium]